MTIRPRLILYACIYTYNSEHVRILMFMRICTYIFSTGLYTLKLDGGITAILAYWQRLSSPFTVETGVRDLKTRKAFCIILNTFLGVNFRNGVPLMSSDFLVVPCKKEEMKNLFTHTHTYIYYSLMYVYTCILFEYLCLLMYTDVY
jgi:hypothetical protein